jgi:hypothetical protein
MINIIYRNKNYRKNLIHHCILFFYLEIIINHQIFKIIKPNLIHKGINNRIPNLPAIRLVPILEILRRKDLISKILPR